MCGISGWLGPGFEQDLATRMCDALLHRGPDGRGEWREEDVWLAHRRLAIIDLSPSGSQPMISPCGRYVLTFNGEIYNYRSLRSRLISAGHVFRGESDSEVLLVACMAWGIDSAVRQIEGMFAFALYDRQDRVLWLARDPIGIKPIFYTCLGENFAFSSELTPLLILPWVKKSIDNDALFSYFRYGCVPAPISIFEEVKKLASGHLLRFKDGHVKTQSFWNLAECAKQARQLCQKNISLKEAADILEKHLTHSVETHMQSDVPYGAFLSGGIDSSTVVALMQSVSSQPVKTFSIGFTEASHDESVYARSVAAHLGTEHHELILGSDEVPGLASSVADFFDEPFADNSAIPTYLLSRFARESVKVCLSGDGGDELFGGYPRYFWARRIELFRRRLLPFGVKMIAKLLRAIPPWVLDRMIDPALGSRYSGSEGLAHRVRRFAAYLECGRSDSYIKLMSFWPDPSDVHLHAPCDKFGADALHYPELPWAEEMMLIDQECYLQDDILTKLDRASMATSLEARVPLLTRAMVEFSWQLDSSLKLSNRGDCGKLVLRELLYRYVPRSLVERPKRGFGMPVGKWLRSSLRGWAENLLTPSGLANSGLNVDTVNKIWQEHLSGMNRQAMLWTILMYRQWHKRVMGC